MRIGLVVFSLQPGGTERVAALLANIFSANSNDVTVYTLDNSRLEPFFDLHSNVELHKLGSTRGPKLLPSKMLSSFAKYLELRCQIKRDEMDVVISFTSEVNILVLLALMGSGVPVLVSERSDPAIIPRSHLWRALRTATYKLLPQTIVVQSQYARKYFESMSLNQVEVIENPVSVPRQNELLLANNDRCVRIHGVGRMVREKRYDNFMRVVSLLVNRMQLYEKQFRLVGDGPEYNALKGLAQSLKIENKIELPGFVANPWEQVQLYDIFVQCSDFEGFPNALFEAMSIGCAVITTKYSSAVTESIEHGRNGLIVEKGDSEGLLDSLELLMGDCKLRKQLGDEARKDMIKYAPEKIMHRWCELLKHSSVAKTKSR